MSMLRTGTQEATSRPRGGGPRIFYAAGPGNVLGVYRNWREGRDDPDQVAMAYSGQFFDLCRDLGASAHVVCANPRAEILEDGPFLIEHRPVPLQSARGAAYHVGQTRYTAGLIASARRFRADVAVIAGIGNWFLLSGLARSGVRVVPTLHCVLWPKYRRPRVAARAFRSLNGRFFARTAAATLSLSDDITKQVLELTGGAPRGPIVPFRPNYPPGLFADQEPPPPRPPFRVLYAGRVERYKGVFDLLEIAQRFEAEGRLDIEFDLCGSGGALEELRARVAETGLAGRFRLHGHGGRDVMEAMFRKCHAVVVPTTTDFIEGFNKVVAEGVIAGRPVVTSAVCPALEYVRDAVIAVPPDDARAYGDAILQLATDPEIYEAKRRACASSRDQFFDRDRGWGAALHAALRHLGLAPAAEVP